jgi:hypothetical protein
VGYYTDRTKQRKSAQKESAKENRSEKKRPKEIEKGDVRPETSDIAHPL